MVDPFDADSPDIGIDRIHAPFGPEQVEQLNRYQEMGMMHPFTCPRDHRQQTKLTATPEGWVCGHGYGYRPVDLICDYTQDWAHAFMANKQLLDEFSS